MTRLYYRYGSINASNSLNSTLYQIMGSFLSVEFGSITDQLRAVKTKNAVMMWGAIACDPKST